MTVNTVSTFLGDCGAPPLFAPLETLAALKCDAAMGEGDGEGDGEGGTGGGIEVTGGGGGGAPSLGMLR